MPYRPLNASKTHTCWARFTPSGAVILILEQSAGSSTPESAVAMNERVIGQLCVSSCYRQAGEHCAIVLRLSGGTVFAVFFRAPTLDNHHITGYELLTYVFFDYQSGFGCREAPSERGLSLHSRSILPHNRSAPSNSTAHFCFLNN